MSKIAFTCFNCGKSYKVPEQFAAKKVKCKQCDATMRVPSESGGSSDPSGGGSSTETKRTATKTASAEKKPSEPASESSSSARSSSASAKVKGKSRTGTVIVELPDISDQRKIYEKKRDDDEEQKPGTGRLVLFVDEKPAKSFRLGDKSLTIGRGAGSDVKLDDDSVSSSHAKIEKVLGKFVIADLKSSNKVHVNFKQKRRARLRNGDLIQIGRIVLRIDCY